MMTRRDYPNLVLAVGAVFAGSVVRSDQTLVIAVVAVALLYLVHAFFVVYPDEEWDE